MAKQGSTRDRPNPRQCPSIKLVSLTGRRSFGFHQGQRSAYRIKKSPDTWLQALPPFQVSFFLATQGASIHDSARGRDPANLHRPWSRRSSIL